MKAFMVICSITRFFMWVVLAVFIIISLDEFKKNQDSKIESFLFNS